MFGDQDNLIAEIKGETGEICTYDNDLDGGRLKLDKTGSLTITDIEPADTGLYELKVITSRDILHKRFRVSIPCK